MHLAYWYNCPMEKHKCILPQEFIEKIKGIFPPDIVKRIIEGYKSERQISVRVNTLKANENDVLEILRKADLEPQIVTWMKSAFTLPYSTSRQLTDLQIYKDGLFYIQSLSSMIPALILDPKVDELILDMAAAPGSKTTQMAAMMKNSGRIIANEPNRSRLFKLKQNLETQDVQNTEVLSLDGQSLWKKYPEYFDKVLIDVPCSVEGTFACSDPRSYSYWSPRRIKQLSKMQKWLLRSAVSCTKPGGTIIYSTCTLSPEENEEVIEWLLEKEKTSIILANIDIPEIEIFPSFKSYKHKTFHPDLQKTMRILPSQEMEGFFVAKILKKDSNVLS